MDFYFFFLTEECVECVRINFRYIRKKLHFEITIDNLVQHGVLKTVPKPKTDNRIQRGMLVKESIRKGSKGCECLLNCLKSQHQEIFEQILEAWRERRAFGKYLREREREFAYLSMSHKLFEN